MANLKIYPTKLRGRVKIPPSKSIAHRAIICASLSDKICKIENIDYADDIIATIEGMKALGASIVKYDDYLEIVGIYKSNKENNEFRIINCNESGSTLRFLVPISMLFSGKSKFVGKGNLGKRPLTTYYNIFENQGIEKGKLNTLKELLKVKLGTLSSPLEKQLTNTLLEKLNELTLNIFIINSVEDILTFMN